MDKKKGSRLLAVIIFCTLLWVVKDIPILWPWLGILLGIPCIFCPRAVWKIFGGFVHPSERPNIFAVNRMRRVGVLLVVASVGKMISDGLLGK